MLETIAYSGGFFVEPHTIIAILIFGYLGCNREKFSRVIVATLFAIILANFLESIFDLPPSSHGDRFIWAVPSVRLMTSLVLWLSIAWEFRSKLFLFLAILINVAISFELLLHNHSFPLDIPASIIFSLLWIATLHFAIQKCPNRKSYELYLFFAVIGLAINLLNNLPAKYNYYIWQANAALFGFGLGWGIVTSNNINYNDNKVFKAIRALIGGLGFAIIYYIFAHLNIKLTDSTTAFFEFFLLSLWVSLFTEQLCKPFNKIFLDGKKKHN